MWSCERNMLTKVLGTPGKARSATTKQRPRAYSKCCGLTKPEKRPRKQRRSQKESSVQWAVFERVLQVDNPTFRKVIEASNPSGNCGTKWGSARTQRSARSTPSAS